MEIEKLKKGKNDLQRYYVFLFIFNQNVCFPFVVAFTIVLDVLFHIHIVSKPYS